MMRFKFIIVGLCFLFFYAVGMSQTKSEKEERISSNMFPENAISFLSELPKNVKKIKYYKETNDTIISYEAKLKLNKKNYSIEFSQNGILEDIEITIKLNDMPEAIRIAILSYLKTTYDSFEILKVQKQYKNPSEPNSKALLNKAVLNNSDEGVYYELVTVDNNIYKEFTFNDSGDYLFDKTITLSTSDDVQY